jgi:hypothetical protein
MRARHILVAGGLCLGLVTTAVPITAASALQPLATTAGAALRPKVMAFKATPRTLSFRGGTVRLRAKVRRATTCDLRSSVPVAGLPRASSCAAGRVFDKVTIRRNATGAKKRIVFTLKAVSGHRRTNTRVVVTEAAPLLKWSVPSIDPGFALYTVSCPTTTSCVAADNDGNVFTYNGTSWSELKDVDPPNQSLTSVSCPTTTFCVAMDQDGNALTYNGTSWSAPKLVDSDLADSVSCPTTRFCAAVDQSGNALTYNGTSWSAPKGVDGDNSLHSVSCATKTFCVAVDNSGHALTYNGTSWSAPRTIDTDRVSMDQSDLLSVSCSTSTFCVATDAYGEALIYNGTSWSAPKEVDKWSTDSVSCATKTFCVAVDDNTHALTYNGTSWSAPQVIDPTPEGVTLGINSVSCPTTTFCVAVDNSGHALVGRL